MTTSQQILFDAADVIRRRGLYRGGYMPPGADPGSCPVCAYGAMRVAAGYTPSQWNAAAADAARRFGLWLQSTGRQPRLLVGAVHRWNDQVCADAAEAAATLWQAAWEMSRAGR